MNHDDRADRRQVVSSDRATADAAWSATGVLEAAEWIVLSGAEFGFRMEERAEQVERAYQHAVSTSGFDHGVHRKWRRPTDADPAWTSRVLRWARSTVAGPWFLPPGTGELVGVLLKLLVADSHVVTRVELHLIRSADERLVVVAVADREAGASDERVRLVGVVSSNEVGASLELREAVAPC